MTRAIRGCLLLIAIAVAYACAPVLQGSGDRSQLDAPGLDDVIAMNTRALGGEKALNAVHAMTKRSIIEEGDYRDIAIFTADRNGRMRVDIYAGGERVFAESFDGSRGYQWQPKAGQTDASTPGTVALSHTPQLPNHVLRLKDLAANGHTVELLGSEMIDGVNHFVLEVTLSDGFQTFYFVDSETGFATRARNRRAFHVDIDDAETTVESRISDFKQVGGIRHPYSVMEVDLKTNTVLARIALESIELNPTLPEDYFSDLVDIAPQPISTSN